MTGPQRLRTAALKALRSARGSLTAGAASAAVTCLFVLVTVLAYQVAVAGSAADWIASLANAVMAVTAVLAFIVARSWLPQLTTQEGYKLAIQLVNDHYMWLGMQNSVVPDVSMALRYIRHQVDGESMAGSEQTAESIIKKLDEAVLRHKVRRDKMEQIRFCLGTYGLRPAWNYAERFHELDRAYRHAADAAGAILGIAKETYERFNLYPPDSQDGGGGALTRQFYITKVEEALASFKLLSEQFMQMVELHDAIFSSEPSIGQLFVVKK
ncbi:hypothetical protein C7431_110119 [Pantoea allii]|uniref:5-bromo-4-chloroindolyl phosphate hydrolysis protein n=1 Tax=Pantoea allii TaxID=574096 RepID=A0A2V2BD05_9GAMM|nr:hypothetical protein [Pantoea allii]PWK94623.1 hypothetical protein C7431_110119 [Pantoea allii]